MPSRLAGVAFVSLISAAGLFAAVPALAQDKPVQLKLSHWVPPSHPLQKAMEDWGNSIQKDSDGSITFTVFPAQQLGKAFDHYDMARDGIADVTYINPGYQPGRFPIIGAGELPFLMKDAKGGSQALDAWYRKYADKEMKDVRFCLGFVHDPGAIHSRSKKVMVPGDIKGMKIRPAHATIAAFVTELGGTNVQAAAPEVRDVLEKGVADAVTFPWGSVPLFGIDKVTKYHMDVPLYVTTFAWVMNKNVYNAMSAAQKKVIDNHCTNEWALRVAAPWADFEHAGIAKIKAEAGHEVYSISADQLAQWRKAAEPLQAVWANNVRKAGGGDPDVIMKELKASLAKYHAAY
jgi:TRAP-type C4-dicarboxylate transport system substrate-binding protein